MLVMLVVDVIDVIVNILPKIRINILKIKDFYK